MPGGVKVYLYLGRRIIGEFLRKIARRTRHLGRKDYSHHDFAEPL
jgi:hypothetical protein